MDSKFSVLSTVKAHYSTFVDDQTDDPRPADYVTAIGTPAGVGVVVGGLMAWRNLEMNEIEAFIGGVAIFTALLFGLVIYVFQLRMQLDGDLRVPRNGRLMRLVDQLFSNVNYSVVVGVVTTVIAMTAAAFASDDGGVSAPWAGVLVALGLHLVLSVFMCIKRVQSAFGLIRLLPRTTSV